MPRRKKISFDATIKVPKRVNVNFKTKRGEKVSFKAVKKASKKVRVTFYAKKKKD